MSHTVRILGLSGSLRQASLNTALLRAAQELLPGNATLEIHPLNALPFYDGDLETLGVPASVALLKQKIQLADALLIATPEYNYSVAPALKNAIDWASRPYGESVVDGKPIAIFGAGGSLGTVRAQMHLRDIAAGTNMMVLNTPEVFVTHADTKFDIHLQLTDETTRAIIGRMLMNLVAWSRRFPASRNNLELAT